MIKSQNIFQNIFTLFLLLCFCSSIGLKEQSNLEENLRSTVIDITVTDFYSFHDEYYVGRKGVLAFSTDYYEDEYGIFEKLDNNTSISFEANIIDGNETEYSVTFISLL